MTTEIEPYRWSPPYHIPPPRRSKDRGYSTRDEEIYRAVVDTFNAFGNDPMTSLVACSLVHQIHPEYKDWEIRRQLRYPEFELTDDGWQLPERRRLF